jgi:cholesterol 7-dehydrogenase
VIRRIRLQRHRKARPRPSDEVRLASYPPPFPDGWYRLMGSDELRAGEIRYIECLGRQLVVWRSQCGKSVHALTAFCPHLGANMADGRVVGDDLECPFHHWVLTGEGRVACVPYSDRTPEGTQNESFPTCEANGQIFVFHRAAGPPSRADDRPPFQVHRIPEVEDGRFVYRGHHDGGRVHMHLVEFAENSVDFAHFVPLHSRLFIPWTRIPIPGVRLEHVAEWKQDDEDPYTAYFCDNAALWFRGKRVERGGAQGVARFTGPGSVVNFRFAIPDLGEIELVQTHLPVAPLEQQVDFHWFADPKVPRLVSSYVVGSWISQWKQDITIWENKVYLPRPNLMRGDGPIHRLRRWYRQFYPEASPGDGVPSPDSIARACAADPVTRGRDEATASQRAQPVGTDSRMYG